MKASLKGILIWLLIGLLLLDGVLGQKEERSEKPVLSRHFREGMSKADYGNNEERVENAFSSTPGTYKIEPGQIAYGQPNAKVISSKDNDLATVTIVKVQKMEDIGETDYTPSDPVNTLVYDVDTQKLSLVLKIEKHEWYYIKSMKDSDSSQYTFTKDDNYLIGVREPSFEFVRSYQFLNKDAEAPNLSFSIKFLDETVASEYKDMVYLNEAKIECALGSVEKTLDCNQQLDPGVISKEYQVNFFDTLFTAPQVFTLYAYELPKTELCRFTSLNSPMTFTLNTVIPEAGKFTAQLRNEDNSEIKIDAQVQEEGLKITFNFDYNDATITGDYRLLLIKESDAGPKLDKVTLTKAQTVKSIGKLYGKTTMKQSFNITYDKTVTASDIDATTFTLSDGKSNSQTFTCILQSDSITFSCTDIVLNNWPIESTYTLSWQSSCKRAFPSDQKISLLQIEDVIQLSKLQFWVKHIAFDITIPQIQKEDVKISFSKEGSLETFKINQVILQGEKTSVIANPTPFPTAGVYVLHLEIGEDSIPTSKKIKLYDKNPYSNPFKGDCAMNYPRCLNEGLSLEGLYGDEISLEMNTTLDQTYTQHVIPNESGQYKLSPNLFTVEGKYNMVVYGEDLFFFWENVEVIADPELSLLRDFFIEGQGSKVTLASKAVYPPQTLLTLLCSLTDPLRNVIGTCEQSKCSFDLVDNCLYALTDSKQYPVVIKNDTYHNFLIPSHNKCLMIDNKFDLRLDNPESILDFGKLKGILADSKHQFLADFTQNGDIFTVDYVVASKGTFFYTFHYDRDKDFPLFSVPATITVFAISSEDLIIDAFTIEQLECLPTVSVQSSEKPLHCDKTLTANAMTCKFDDSFEDIGELTINVANAQSKIKRYKTFVKGTHVIEYNKPIKYNQPSTITISSENGALDAIKSVKLQLKEDGKTNDIASLKYDRASNSFSFDLIINDNEWYYVISMTDGSTSYEFDTSKSLIGIAEPSFSLLKDYQFISDVKTSQTISFTLEFAHAPLDSYATNIYLNKTLFKDPCLCLINNMSLECSVTLTQQGPQVYAIQLLVPETTFYTSPLIYNVYTYQLPDESMSCQMKGKTKEASFTLRFLIQPTNLIAYLKSEEAEITGTPTLGDSLLLFSFDVSKAGKGDYQLYVKNGTKEGDLLDSDYLLSLLETKILSPPISIIENHAYPQSVSIAFTEKVTNDDVTEFFLYDKSATNKVLYQFKGNLKDKAFECKDFNYKLSQTGRYTLGWTNKCNIETHYEGQITLISRELISIKPSTVKLIKDTPTVITVEFNFNVEHAGKVEVVFKDNDLELLNKKYEVKAKENSLTVTLGISQESGSFNVLCVLGDGSQIIDQIIGNLLIYTEDMKIQPSQRIVPENSIMNSVTISFDSDVFMSRFSLIQYYDLALPGNPIPVDKYAVNRLKKEVTLGLSSNQADFIVDKTYVFRFKDSVDGTTHNFKLISMPLPSTVEVPDYYFLLPITVKFEKSMKANDFTVTTSDNFSFIIAETSASNAFSLTLVLPQEKVQYGSKPLVFTLKGESQPFLTSKDVLFIDQSYPQQIINTEITQSLDDKLILIKLEEDLYDEYIDLFIITLSDKSKCDNKGVIPQDKTLIVMCDSIKTTGLYTIESLFITEQLNSVELTVIKCDRHQIITEKKCSTCKDYNPSTPLFEENKCVDSCTNVEWNEVCYHNCTEAGDSLFLSENSNKCVESCPNILHYKRKCVTECPNYPYQTYKSDNECLDSCRVGSTPNKYFVCEEETSPSQDCNDYCLHEGTCLIINSVRECKCPSEYHGLICEIKTPDLKKFVNESSDRIFNVDNSTPIDLETVSNILNLKNVIKENEVLAEDITIETEKVINRFNQSSEIIQVERFVRMTLEILRIQLSKFYRSPRQLEEIPGRKSKKELRDTIREVIKHNHLFLVKKFNEILDSFTCQDPLDEDQYCLAFENETTYKDYENKAKEKNWTIISLENIFDNLSLKSYKVLQIELTSNLTTMLSDTEYYNSTSNEIYVFIYNTVKNEVISPGKNTFTVKSVFSPVIKSEDFSLTLYGIDIFDMNNEVFINPCYINEALKYDLVQEYRRKQLYSGKAIVPSSRCSYRGLDQDLKDRLTFECKTDPDFDMSFSYEVHDAPLPNNTYQRDINIPTSCAYYVTSIHKNIAFWLFLMIIIVYIFAMIVLSILRCCKIVNYQRYTILERENIELQIREEDAPMKPSKSRNNNNKSNYLDIGKDFPTILCDNLLNLHPFTAMCQESILSPVLLRMAIFVFNLFVQFGFLAIYYFEDKIDKRRYRSDRDNFIYPIKYEYDKLIYAVLTSIGFTLLIKTIVLVTLTDKKELSSKVEGVESIEQKYEKVDDFAKNMFIRRIIAFIIMIGLSVFFYYYCVVFCGIYIHTQFDWFYSCLWLLFFNWLLFAPFIILLLSLCETVSQCEGCVYYFKQLFFF